MKKNKSKTNIDMANARIEYKVNAFIYRIRVYVFMKLRMINFIGKQMKVPKPRIKKITYLNRIIYRNSKNFCKIYMIYL